MFGKNLKIEIFGESHGEKIGVKVENLKRGYKINKEELQKFLDLRAPGRNQFSTPRKEADKVEITSGVDEHGVTDGSIFEAVIYNTNTRSQDYEKTVPRPGHADYPAYVKYNKIPTGGGRYSGRLTAPLCIIGGIALQILKTQGINIDAHILSVHGKSDVCFDSLNDAFNEVYKKSFPVIDDALGEELKEEILKAKEEGDSVGGKVECKITGLPIGLGDALFDGLDGHIAEAVFAIPAVKGIEFGKGFEASELYGSENNDEYYFDDGVKIFTNNAGGVLGGMSSGFPLIFTVAFKPTPSIYKEQRSVDLKTSESTMFSVKGRHDPCIVQRAVAPVISAAAIAVLDLLEEV